ncbi:MAG: WD40 repeat domain-containing protein, partial [Nannocystaceae bacterium]
SRDGDTTTALERALQAAELSTDDETRMEVERALYTAVWNHREKKRLQLAEFSDVAWFHRERDAIVVTKEEMQSLYDFELNLLRRERQPRLDDPDVRRGEKPPRVQAPKRSRSLLGRFLPSSTHDERIRWQSNDDEIESCVRSGYAPPVTDPKGETVIVDRIFDGVGFYNASNPCLEYPLGNTHGGASWDIEKHIDISPTRSRILYTGAGTNNRRATWAEPRIVDTRDGSTYATLGGHEEMVITAEYSDDGEQAFTLSKSGILRLWTTEPYIDVEILSKHGGCIMGQDCGSEPEATDGSHLQPLAKYATEAGAHGGPDNLTSAEELSGGASATAGTDGRVLLWDAGSRGPAVLYKNEEPINALFTLDPSNLYALSSSALLRIALDDEEHRIVVNLREFDHNRSIGSHPLNWRVYSDGRANNATLALDHLILDIGQGKILWQNWDCEEPIWFDPLLNAASCLNGYGPSMIFSTESARWSYQPLSSTGEAMLGQWDSLYNTSINRIDKCPRGIITVGGGSAETYIEQNGVFFDFERGREIIRTENVPGLRQSGRRLEGIDLPVFCTFDDLAGYSRDLLASIEHSGEHAVE